MKKLIYLLLIISLGMIVSSCVDDNDEHAEATVDFQGVLTSLSYSTSVGDESQEEITEDDKTIVSSDSTLSFDFTNYLTEAFEELGLIGEKSRITEKTKVEGTSSIGYAILVCASKASVKITKKLDDTDVSMVRNTLYRKHGDEMKTMGYNSPDELPITKLSADFTYYNSMNSSVMTFSKIFL